MQETFTQLTSAFLKERTTVGEEDAMLKFHSEGEVMSIWLMAGLDKALPIAKDGGEEEAATGMGSG
jgi:hypothetical protein